MEQFDKFITIFFEEWQEIWFRFTFKIAKAKNTNIPPSYSIFRNCNMSLKLIEKYTQYPWDYAWLSQNPNLTIDFILKHRNKKWSWSRISKHHKITMEMILNNPDLPWDWKFVGANPNVTVQHILDNPDLPWDWIVIGNQNPNLTAEFILKNYDKMGWCDYSQFFQTIGTTANNTMMRNSTLWNKNISFDFVAEHPEIIWNFELTAYSDCITMEAIESYPTISWCWALMIGNKNLTIDFIFANAQKIPHWFYFTSNSNITTDTIKNHPEFDWKKPNDIGSNPNIPMKFMLEHPELEMKDTNHQGFMVIGENPPPPIYKWVLSGTSRNETLSMQFVLDNLDLPWCVDELMENKFLTDAVAYVRQKINWLLIMAMYEQNNPIDIAPFNMILHDEYLVKMIAKY